MGVRKFLSKIMTKLGIKSNRNASVIASSTTTGPFEYEKISPALKEFIKTRFNDTALVIYQDQFKSNIAGVPDVFDKAAYSEGYLIFGTTKAITSYSQNGNKPLILYRTLLQNRE